MTLYEVRDWERCYTVSQNRKNDPDKPLPWVAMRTKHDGKGFRRVMRLPDSMALMGAWMLIVEVAAKCPTHGVLADSDGPLTALDLADKTGGDEATFHRALQVFSSQDIAWLTGRALPEHSTAFGLRDGMGQDGTERNGTEQNGTSKDPTSFSSSSESGFDASVVSMETLSDVARLRRWVDHDLTRRDTICDGSEAFWTECQAAAAKARKAPGVVDPVALFKWLIRGKRWNYLRGSDDDVARLLRRESTSDPFALHLLANIGKAVSA